jgi:ABC-2 type transport system permease protein
MSPRRIYAIVLRYAYLLQGSPARAFSLYVWVAINMVMWGLISRYLNSVSATPFNFVSVFLGAVLLSDFMARVTFGIVTTFFEDVWSRNFLNLFASPLRVSEYLAGLVVSGIVTSSIGLVLMVALAVWMFGLDPWAYGVTMVPYILILFLTGIALGIFGVSLVLRLGPSGEWLIWPIPAIVSPFVGVFYPIASLPHWMQHIAYLLPPTYVFEGMRAILAGKLPILNSLSLGIGLSLLYIGAAGWFFTATYRRAMRLGIIARYSAENAS